MVTKEQFAARVEEARRWVASGDELAVTVSDQVIAALAAERDESVELLKNYPFGDGAESACDVAVFGDDHDTCDGERNQAGENIGGYCWEHRRRAFLARTNGGT